METIRIGKIDYKLWRHVPQWDAGLSMEHALQTVVAKGDSGRQSRWPWLESMRTKMTPQFKLGRDGVGDLDELLLEDKHLRWAVPVWVSMARAANGLHDAIYRSAYTLNFDDTGFVAFQEGAVPEVVPYKWLVPLMFASVKQHPEIGTKGAKLGVCPVAFEEDCLYNLRLRINEVELAQPSIWPAKLKPDWQKNLQLSRSDLEYTEIGRYRESLIDGDESAPVFGQEATFKIHEKRNQGIRTLLSHWQSRQGRLKSFEQPVFFVSPDGYGKVGTSESGESVVKNPVVGYGSDRIRLHFKTPSIAETSLRFWQRPTEENGGVEGDEPEQNDSVQLLEFEYKIPKPIFYRFAIYGKDLMLYGNNFKSAPFKLSDPVWAMNLEESKLTVESWRFDGNPLNKLIPFNLEGKLMLTVYEVDPEDVGGSVKVFWKGEITEGESDDRQLAAKCVVFGPAMDAVIPRNKRGPGCPHCVFDSCCRADEGKYRRSAVITALNDSQITISGIPDGSGWLERGRLETGHGEFFEHRPIEGHEGNVLDIVKPLNFATVGQAVTLWPGCSGEWDVCNAKFENGLNFGGRPHGVESNPSIQTADPIEDVSKK